MKLDVTLGCEICGFSSKVTVNKCFNCENLICPVCQNENCLSITSASEKLPSGFSKQNILQRLKSINLL